MFKFPKAVLITFLLLGVSAAWAEKSSGSLKDKETLIESELNTLFKRSLNVSAGQLDKKMQLNPFAVILKKDGEFGYIEVPQNQKTKELSVMEQVARIRTMLKDVASVGSIKGSVISMYATVTPEDGVSRQGLTFEVEHVAGVSLLRFMPVTKGKVGSENEGKLVFHVESLTTSVKPRTVFSESLATAK